MADLEIYPDEKNRIVSAWSAIQAKYGTRVASHENLVAMANEAENRFRDELGLKVIVDISNIEISDDGEPYLSPVISIEDRVVSEDGHDFERHSWEVQHGFEDGVEGSVSGDGKMSEVLNRKG